MNRASVVTPLSAQDQQRALAAIVRAFVNGDFNPGRYLFEQLPRMPIGRMAVRRPSSEAVLAIKETHEVVYVLLDPHPSNRSCAEEVASSLGLPDERAFVVPIECLAFVLSHDTCDMYVTSIAGDLLVVGCHEDRVLPGGREVWCVVAST